ncbi:MAG TPA: hypothetical protein VGJ26_11560 [Pirellulales bacterium]|jgi:hypothetical protein
MAKKRQASKQKPVPAKRNKRALAESAANPHGARLVKRFKIERHVPDDLRPVLSNHFVVHHDEGMFRLFFFDITPPLFLGDDIADVKRQAEAIKSLPAKCVAEVVMSSEHMAEVIKVLITNFQKSQNSSVADGSRLKTVEA